MGKQLINKLTLKFQHKTCLGVWGMLCIDDEALVEALVQSHCKSSESQS